MVGSACTPLSAARAILSAPAPSEEELTEEVESDPVTLEQAEQALKKH